MNFWFFAALALFFLAATVGVIVPAAIDIWLDVVDRLKLRSTIK